MIIPKRFFVTVVRTCRLFFGPESRANIIAEKRAKVKPTMLSRSPPSSKAKQLGNFNLPVELWTHVFDFAVDDDVLLQYALPNAMAESAWFKTMYGDWALRPPQQALNLIQRKNYATKKVF